MKGIITPKDVPGLWNGAPPMGKASSHYSKAMLKLNREIIRSAAAYSAAKKKKKTVILQSWHVD